jgi:hypothetical protein
MVLSFSFFLQDFLKFFKFPLLLDFYTFYNVEQSSRSRISGIREPFFYFIFLKLYRHFLLKLTSWILTINNF